MIPQAATVTALAIGMVAAGHAEAVAEDGVSCDASVEEFRKTGTVRCGHFLWDLQPEHAAKMEDPLSYFKKYEKYYAFMADLTGLEPKTTPIPVRERCSARKLAGFDCDHPDRFGPLPPSGPGCTKGYLPYCYPAYRLGDELFMDEATVGSDVVYTANHPAHPLFSSFTHEIGHMFQPFDARDRGYRWDNVGTESWADNLALVGYLVYSEVFSTGESWYWDGFCDRKEGKHPCDTFLRTVDDYAWMDADKALLAYEEDHKQGATGLFDIVRVPVDPGLNGHQDGRDHVLTGMLIDLYRDFKKRGRPADFFVGFRDTIRFYHQRFPSLVPENWLPDDREQSRALLEAKANVFVYLLSVHTKADLSMRFADWRWPIHPATRRAIRAASRDNGSEEGKLKGLRALLRFEFSRIQAAR